MGRQAFPSLIVLYISLTSSQCEICGRPFARNEHLVRHRRIREQRLIFNIPGIAQVLLTRSSAIDTREKPFDCSLCQIKFPRADVRENHMKRYHAAGGGHDERTSEKARPPQQRSKQACAQCRRRKLKCDEQRPCQGCCTRKLPCVVSDLSRGSGRPRNDETQAITNSLTELDMLDHSEPVDTTLSATATVTQIQEQTPSSTHNVSLSTFDTSFPENSAVVLEEAVSLGPRWEDMDFMDGLWDLPPLEVETWLHDLDDSPPIFGAWTQNEPSSNDSQMDYAIDIMASHFQRGSRASSPTTHGAERLWYSAPPLLQMYDRDVINVLLNVARRHLSATFPLFAHFQANKNVSHELCLAMAAVGGLFTTVDGSSRVAKALYNDARRMHLEKDRELFRPPSLETSLNSVKTFVLLAIYGICSGDKRSYEFVEAFHQSTSRAAKECWRSANIELDQAHCQELPLVSEALDMIECYHVLLYQRPPYLLATSPQHEWHISSIANLASLMTPVGQSSDCADSLHEIASLGAYTWMASPRGQEHSRGSLLWRSEYMQLALENWREASACSCETPQLSSLLLYHLAHIHLQVNVGLLQRFAHVFTKTPNTPNEKKIFTKLQQCISGQPFKVSFWHDRAMLLLVKDSFSMPTRRQRETSHKERLPEPPHLPYCIYFATLLVWYGEHTSTCLARDACIETGIQLLDMLEVRVASVLASALCELFPEERRAQT